MIKFEYKNKIYINNFLFITIYHIQNKMIFTIVNNHFKFLT